MAAPNAPSPCGPTSRGDLFSTPRPGGTVGRRRAAPRRLLIFGALTPAGPDLTSPRFIPIFPPETGWAPVSAREIQTADRWRRLSPTPRQPAPFWIAI